MSDHSNVAIFWDYENCSPPSSSCGLGYDIANNIRRIARLVGSVTTFRAYLDVSAQSPKSVALRSELQSSGVSMIDCPHNGKKDVVDKMILVDMLAFAVDHPAPATVFLITGDRDYSYAVSTLRLRKYQVILVVPSPQASPCLESQASLVIDWSAAILRTRAEAASSTQAIRQHVDLDPNLTAKILRELRELTLDDPDATLRHPYSASPTTSKVRRTSARDLLEQSKHAKNIASIDSTQELGFNQAFLRKYVAAGNDPTLGGPSIPKTPSCSRGASVSTGPTRVRSATTVAQLAEDIPQKHPPPSSARRSSASDVTDVAGSAKQSLSAGFDVLELPSHDNRPPSSINIRSPLEPGQTTDDVSDTSSSHKLNCLASPFLMTMAPAALEPIPSPGKQSHTTIKPASPIVSPAKTLVDTVTSVNKTSQVPAFEVPTEVNQIVGLCIENNDEYSEQSRVRRRVLTAEEVTDATDMSKSNHYFYAASSASSGNAQLADIPLSKHVSLPEVAYLGTGEGNNPAQLEFTAFSRAPNGLDHPTRGFGSVPSSGAFPSTSLTTTESHEHDESELHQTWTMFEPLIHSLFAARQRGIAHPSRSTIALELVQLDKQVYQHVGVSRFRDYTALAERMGIIELGGKGADAWIALHPNWFRQGGVTTTHFLSTGAMSPTSDPPNAIQAPLLTGTKTSLTESPAIVLAPTPAPPKPNSFESSNTLLTAATDRLYFVPARFQPLIDILIRLRADGTFIALRSLVGQSLGQNVYAQAGVSGFKEYIQQASDAQLIECGGVGGQAWIRLHPEL